MKHIHIASISPRAGTTLLMELMVSCFEFDGYADHELELLFHPTEKVDRFCSKNPGYKDLQLAPSALRRWPDLWIICLVRDPRDIVVSRHKKQPDAYWSNFGKVFDHMRYFETAKRHERFIVVRYEDLVKDPNAVQADLMKAIPFLKKRFDFSEFPKIASPTKGAVEALGGVRKISTSSIGRWENELPRLKAQIERYGKIDKVLSELGYENNSSWQKKLDTVHADNGRSYLEDLPPHKHKPINRLRRLYHILRFHIGFPKKRPIIVAEN